tara:strand:- start:71 stop:961 length:891 start_codon:yes stop_codon:yes gene_type:complete
MARPFLKWAGGKRQLLSRIEERFPPDIENCKTYIEPFIGGGAVLFHMLEKYQFEKVYISDLNPELTLCYEVIQSSIDLLIEELDKLVKNYPSNMDDRKEVYYQIRSDWNKSVGVLDSFTLKQKANRAATTIFLNKTCFNGLFRVNRKGEFNVPIGGYVKPSFPSEDSLRSVHNVLQKVQINTIPFEECLPFVDGETFVYFDPPYRPLSESSSFVSYSKDDFNDEDQAKLSEFFRTLDSIGARLLLSNSDPKNTVPDDNFFDELYSGYKIERVSANRAINSNPEKRGPITELLISNY